MASNSDGTDDIQFASDFESTPNSKIQPSAVKDGGLSIRSNFEQSAIKNEAKIGFLNKSQISVNKYP